MLFSLQKLRDFGDRPCLVQPDGAVLCYAGFAEAAAEAVQGLPQARSLVAVEMAATPQALAAYAGAMAAGHAVMPLPAGDPATAGKLEARFRPAASWRADSGQWQVPAGARGPARIHPDLALLLQTSGSTGHGRGVRLSAGAAAANAGAIAEYLQITPQDRAALILPLHYSYGLSVLHSHLACGASLWLAPGSVLEPGFAAQLAASGATSLAGVPHHFTLLENAGLAAVLPDTLSLLTVAGGAMDPARVERWAGRMAARGGRFVVMYGQTEATARISWLPPELAASHPDAIGRAIPGGRLSLRGSDGQEVLAADAEGELVYEGPNVMMGYAESHADLARGAEVTALATGDMARRDAGGIYRITGRKSRFSKIAGLRIGHDALERGLAAKGYTAAVWGDDRGISVAISGDAAGAAVAAAQLSGIGAQHFTVHPCTELPRRENGKIDYPALKARTANPRPVKDVLALFRAALAPQPVSRQDSFESLGGDSLCHVELSLALDRHMGGAPEGWERMTIAELEKAQAPAAASVPSEIAARGLAILAVVTAHQTLWPVYGGAAAMVMLMGMSVACYRWEALAAADFRGFLKPLAAVLLPYYLILAGYALAWGQMPWVSAVLAGNFALTIPETGLMLPYLYWFIEAYVQMSLLVAAPFLFPPLRRWLAARGRFAAGLCLLAAAVLMRLSLPQLWPMGGRAQFTVPWVFYLFALGWCIAAAQTLRQRLAVLAAACALMPAAAYLGGNWYGGWIKYMSLLVLAAGLIFVPRVPAPRWAVRPAMRLAQAAFPIYLLHRLVPEQLMPALGFSGRGPWTDAAAIGGGVTLGLAAAALWPHCTRVLAALPLRGPGPARLRSAKT